MSLFNRLSQVFKRPGGSGLDEFDAILRQPKGDDIAIDIGANVGNVTKLLAENGAEVHAFEPNPYAFAKLKRTFASNSRVHCYQAAAGTEDGNATLYLHARAAENQVLWSTGSSLDPRKNNVDTTNKVEVQVVNIVRFLTELPKPPRLLKMDIEGAELQVMPPLIDAGLLDNIEWVLVELHDTKNLEMKPQTDALRRLVSERGLANVRLDWM